MLQTSVSTSWFGIVLLFKPPLFKKTKQTNHILCISAMNMCGAIQVIAPFPLGTQIGWDVFWINGNVWWTADRLSGLSFLSFLRKVFRKIIIIMEDVVTKENYEESNIGHTSEQLAWNKRLRFSNPWTADQWSRVKSNDVSSCERYSVSASGEIEIYLPLTLSTLRFLVTSAAAVSVIWVCTLELSWDAGQQNHCTFTLSDPFFFIHMSYVEVFNTVCLILSFHCGYLQDSRSWFWSITMA